MVEIPTIETERLVLRPMVMEDWPRYSALMMSQRSVYMGGPATKWKAWSFFCFDVGQWALMGHGALMIEDKGTGVCLGQVGINSGPFFPEHELGWFLYEKAEGNGFAFEAAKALRDWAFNDRKLTSLVSYMDSDNVRSRQLAERLGAVIDDTAERPDPEDIVYRHFRAGS